MTGMTIPAAVAAPMGRTERSAAPTRFNANIQGARGLLALMVFIFHIGCSGLPNFSVFAANGSVIAPVLCLQYAVEIFFCISGTIVVGALRRARTPAQFLTDRAIRIIPVLWLTLAVVVPLGLATHQAQYATWSLRDLAWIIPANLILLPGAFKLPLLHMAAWSLSYEMLFYIVAVTMWWAAPKSRLVRTIVLCLAIGLIAWQPRAVFFAVGVLVARTDISRHPALARLVRWPAVWLLAFFACWYGATSGGADGGSGSLGAWLLDGRIGLAALGVSAAILAWAGIVAGHGSLCRLLRTKPAQWLGSVSYSFYLWHLIVLAVLKRLIVASGAVSIAGEWSQLMLLAIALPASLLIAQLSAATIERSFPIWWKAVARLPNKAIPGARLA